ncbi:MAG: sodium-dependent transporter [Bacteroidota bacterium]|jgi:NSS family neurotransmitter:Na+ symporter|nr:sodium-dependent transporter [Bacteroidota bacterium]
MSSQKRDGFTSKFGVIAAAAGSAVGLGNLWRFPYITGENGGGAFLLVYIFFVVLIGIPVMMSEFVIGRRSGSNAIGAFRKLAPGTAWWLVGLMGIIAAFVILAFYGTVAGWTLEYIIQAFQNSFVGKSQAELSTDFNNFTASTFRPLLWQIVVMILTAAIVLRGVSKGIEKATKILMPLLIVLILVVCIRSITLPGSSKGLEFLFKPDFSKLTFKAVLMALGQAAFSLSIGMGALITYGSYVRKDTPLLSTSISIAVADTVIAILCGIMVFPALFALGGESTGGPGLVFVTLPGVFQSMPGGYIFGILFFILVFLAAITSTISLLEVVVAYFKEDLRISRFKATVLATVAITVLGVFCTLSFGKLSHIKLFDKTIFGLADYVSANILLTFGALFIVIFTGWYLGKSKFIEEVKLGCKVNPIVLNVIVFIIKWIAPVAIGAIAIGTFFIEGLM